MIQVGIIGVGLMGGSLGMALRRVRVGGKRRYHVVGIGRQRSALQRAINLGAIDEFTLNGPGVANRLDLAVSCVPVPFIAASLAEVIPGLRPGAVLTDVGSVKGPVVRAVRRALGRRRDLVFVGAHPMAGSEKTGVAHASAELFAGTVCALTPEGAPRPSVRAVEKMWAAAGARPLPLSAALHDRIAALTSHLPHVIAFTLAALVGRQARRAPATRLLTAGSYRDMTRVAQADRALWQGIFSANHAETLRALELFYRQARALLNLPNTKAARSSAAPRRR